MMLFHDPNWCDDLFDYDREIDTDFYSKTELEEFKTVKDLSGDHLKIEVSETKEEETHEKEDEARIIAAAFEKQLKSIKHKFESTIRSNEKSLREDLQPLKEESERREQVEWYKNNLGDALYLCAYDQAENLWTYTNKIAEYLKIEKELDQYDTWEMKEKHRAEVTVEFEEAIREMERMVEDLPFY